MFNLTDLVGATVLFEYGNLRGSLPEPNSCAVCGSPAREHGNIWIGNERPGHTDTSGASHGYETPTDALRLIRMKARLDSGRRAR